MSRDTTLLPVWPGLKVRLSSRVAAGISFQLPRGRDVGPHSELSWCARLCLLVAVARLAGRWCFWRLLVFLAGLWVSGCFVSLSEGGRPEDRSEGVGIKEGVPASQSVLLLGPVHLLRWGCHSTSSCDGVSPMIVRADAVLPEGVTFAPHEGSSQPPDTGHQPENWQRV